MKKLLAVFLIILALPFGALAAGDADPLLQRAQSVLDALTNGRYSEISSQFDETMRAAVSEEAIAQGWEAILAQYGGYVGVETTQASSENRSVALTARQQTAFGMNALYLKSMDVLDQAAIADQTEKPFLFLWGESDFQVSRTAFDGWRQALGDGSRYTYLTYAGLNHLFMPAQEGDSLMNVQEAYARPAQVDSAVAADIAAWLAARQP